MANWLEFWENNEINWHSDDVTQELVEYLGLLKLEPGDKVFFPLCGKSVDMIYLLNEGFSVIGVELSEIGIKQFFLENGLDFTMTQVGEFDLYSANNIEIYCGDFFSLTYKHLSNVKAVFDRKSLIALDRNLRQKYVKHLNDIISMGVRILSVSYTHLTLPTILLV